MLGVEKPLDGVGEETLVVDPGRGGAGALEQVGVLAEPREVEIGEPRLAGAEKLPFAADLEVPFCELEAVGRRHHRLEPLPRHVGELLLRPGHEQAIRLLGPAPDASAQLVQLREAEAVGLLDDHDRRVRDVDADLDHRCRDEHVELTGREGPHDGAALRGLQPAVHASDPESLQLGAPQPLGLVLGGARDGRLRGLDQVVDKPLLRGRALPAGARIEIFVTKAHAIGSYVRYDVVRGNFKRTDRCLRPGSHTPRKKCK